MRELDAKTILTYQDVINTFGMPPEDPQSRADWEESHIVPYVFPTPLTFKNPFSQKEATKYKLSWDANKTAKSLRIHALLYPIIDATFKDLQLKGLMPLVKDFGGGYIYRQKRNGKGLSLHSFGIAFDINVKENPYGAIPKMPAVLVKAIEAHGWCWGGYWRNPDGMHFEYTAHGV